MDKEHYNSLARESYHRNKHKHKGARKVYNRVRKQRLKIKAIEYKGGKCEKCLGIFPPCVYDFHHINPEEKDFNPSAALDLTWERATIELDKCLLVCSNCHRELHFNNE